MVKNEGKPISIPPQFAIHQTDPTSILIEAIIPADKPAEFDDAFDVYSKKESDNDQWTKVQRIFSFRSSPSLTLFSYFQIGTIEKDHLNLTMTDLAENTSYGFKIINQSSLDEENNVVQQFNFETASGKFSSVTPISNPVFAFLVKLYDPSVFLKKIEQSLENVVNGVMRAGKKSEISC